MTDREVAFKGCFEKMPTLLERIKSGLEAKGYDARVVQKIERDYNIFMEELRRLYESGQGSPDDVFTRLPRENRWVDCVKMSVEDMRDQQNKDKK